MNALLQEMRRSLLELQLGITGAKNVSSAMEHLAQCLLTNTVYSSWRERAYSSLKPCAAWVADLILRVNQLKHWTSPPPAESKTSRGDPNAPGMHRPGRESKTKVCQMGPPKLPCSVWCGGLFNPMSFLTAIRQITARQYELPLDCLVTWTFFTNFVEPSDVVQQELENHKHFEI